MHSTLTRRFLLSVLLLGCALAAHAADNFLTLALPKGVTVRLPKNWTVLTDNQRTTLETYVQAKMESAGRTDGTVSSLNFAANHYDDHGKVISIFNVRYIPEMTVTQEELRSFTAVEINELDGLMRAEMKVGVELVGSNKLLSWSPVRRIDVNGVPALLMDLRRSSPQFAGASFRIRTLRFVRAAGTVDVTVSYREDTKFEEVVADRVLQAVVVSR